MINSHLYEGRVLTLYAQGFEVCSLSNLNFLKIERQDYGNQVHPYTDKLIPDVDTEYHFTADGEASKVQLQLIEIGSFGKLDQCLIGNYKGFWIKQELSGKTLKAILKDLKKDLVLPS